MKAVMKDYEGMQAIPNGTLKTFDMEMKPYPDARMRTIRVWLPEDYDGVKRFPVLYMHDGQNLFRGMDERLKWDCDRAMTQLAKEGISCIVVGIDTAKTRGSELQPPYPRDPGFRPNTSLIPPEATGHLYAEFVIHHLKPLIDETFMTLPDAANTGIGGSSMGGLQSYYMATEYPEVFGRALCFSPALPLNRSYIFEQLDSYDFSRLAESRICFYNGDQTADDTITETVVELYRKMTRAGMDSHHLMLLLDTRQPHFESAWAEYFPLGVRFLFAADNGVIMPPVFKKR